MKLREKIKSTQEFLTQQNLDGWLLYDFRRNNDLACQFLEIGPAVLLTRRFFYWIPKQGEPVKIVHGIEEKSLENLPGRQIMYRTWQELEHALETILKGSGHVAMEYSPRNALPYLSKVDAGTVEMVRSKGVEVVTSAKLLQQFNGVWDEQKLKSHLEAADVLCKIVDQVWSLIAQHLREGQKITEYDVQQFMLDQFAKNRCISNDAPICAVNAHSANPHYAPTAESSSEIKKSDFVLIDLWCKREGEETVYADITRVAVAAKQPTEKQKLIFDIVRRAQETATQLVRDRFSQGVPVYGWEVDQACRDVIEKAGYGKYFIHRTGHNIDINDHGNGAHIDNYETHDDRELMPMTCFSIEPGIYLPGEFGVRLEYDVVIHRDKSIQVTGGTQNEIVTLS